MTRLIFAVILFVFTFGYAVAYPILKTVHPVDGCACEKFNCGCCLYMDVPEIWLNDTACINFAYDPDAYGISFTVTIDDKTLINETISARNPPPICFPVPLIEDVVDGCVHFTDLNISNTDFHGCVQLELRMWWIYVIAEFKLGCFDTQFSKIFQKLAKQSPKNNVPLFQNIAVNDKHKYNIVPMQDMMPVNEIENTTLASDVEVNVNHMTTIAVPLNQDGKFNRTTTIVVPFNKSLGGNETMTAEALSLCTNKSNSVNLSSYLFLLVALKVICTINFVRLI